VQLCSGITSPRLTSPTDLTDLTDLNDLIHAWSTAVND
jgi:hypothetical protein